MQEDNITIRLKFLIQELGITNSVFAENCGISRATLSQLLTGRNKKISDIIIGQIHAAYPSLSILWLLFNEGEMWTGNAQGDAKDSNPDKEYTSSAPNGKSGISEESDSEFTEFAEPGFTNTHKNPSENTEFPTPLQSGYKNAKENGVNRADKPTQTSDAKGINNCLSSVDFFNEIENLRRKTRKVVQITVYYDDSTFESFYPGKK